MTYTALTDGIPRTAVVSAPTMNVTLRGLEEYTDYSIFVFASTVKGDGNASNPIIVTTDEDSKLPKALRYLTVKGRFPPISYKKKDCKYLNVKAKIIPDKVTYVLNYCFFGERVELNALNEQYNFNSDYFVQDNLDWRVSVRIF